MRGHGADRGSLGRAGILASGTAIRRSRLRFGASQAARPDHNRSHGGSIPLLFRFSYHCCTDKPGKRGPGTRILEDTRPAEDRYFCPARWFLSLRLPALARSLDTARLTPAPGFQWLHTERIPGISLPWAVWVKIVPEPPGGATVVGVESAYLAGAPPRGGQPEAFRFIPAGGISLYH